MMALHLALNFLYSISSILLTVPSLRLRYHMIGNSSNVPYNRMEPALTIMADVKVFSNFSPFHIWCPNEKIPIQLVDPPQHRQQTWRLERLKYTGRVLQTMKATAGMDASSPMQKRAGGSAYALGVVRLGGTLLRGKRPGGVCHGEILPSSDTGNDIIWDATDLSISSRTFSSTRLSMMHFVSIPCPVLM